MTAVHSAVVRLTTHILIHRARKRRRRNTKSPSRHNNAFVFAHKNAVRENTHTIYITLNDEWNDEHTWIELDQDFLFSLRVHSHSEKKAATELGNYIALFSYNPVSAENFCWNSHYSILFWSCCVFISDWEPPLSLILYAHIWSLNGSAYVITLLTQSKTLTRSLVSSQSFEFSRFVCVYVVVRCVVVTLSWIVILSHVYNFQRAILFLPYSFLFLRCFAMREHFNIKSVEQINDFKGWSEGFDTPAARSILIISHALMYIQYIVYDNSIKYSYIISYAHPQSIAMIITIEELHFAIIWPTACSP